MTKFDIRVKQSAKSPLVFIRKQFLGIALKLVWRISPVATKKIIRRRLFTPSRKTATAEQMRLLQAGTTFSLLLRGKRFNCWRWGEGPTIVFAHGWSELGAHFEHFVSPSLAAGYSVVVYDSLSHGESDGADTSYFEQTEVLRAVVREHPDLAAIVGHSFGGAVTIGCVVKEGLEIPVVLIAPALKLQEILTARFSSRGVPNAVWERVVKDIEADWHYAMTTDDPYMLMGDVRSDVLVFHDTDDNSLPFKTTEQLVAQYTNYRLVATSGLGHKNILTDATVIEQVIAHVKNSGTRV